VNLKHIDSTTAPPSFNYRDIIFLLFCLYSERDHFVYIFDFVIRNDMVIKKTTVVFAINMQERCEAEGWLVGKWYKTTICPQKMVCCALEARFCSMFSSS
jgi:hypothetical protein